MFLLTGNVSRSVSLVPLGNGLAFTRLRNGYGALRRTNDFGLRTMDVCVLRMSYMP